MRIVYLRNSFETGNRNNGTDASPGLQPAQCCVVHILLLLRNELLLKHLEKCPSETCFGPFAITALTASAAIITNTILASSPRSSPNIKRGVANNRQKAVLFQEWQVRAALVYVI
ncbi:hypothetical protein E2C01_058011 [Portunus trituberculatus]|uniref:Uncharacterized protein n=1 Tax=Portunus trituberculatus TaxID=210409 RepID=A0A5B7H1I3_PORTR|nr:hypothetical protein [Portunus trituberculatus]